MVKVLSFVSGRLLTSIFFAPLGYWGFNFCFYLFPRSPLSCLDAISDGAVNWVHCSCQNFGRYSFGPESAFLCHGPSRHVRALPSLHPQEPRIGGVAHESISVGRLGLQFSLQRNRVSLFPLVRQVDHAGDSSCSVSFGARPQLLSTTISGK